MSKRNATKKESKMNPAQDVQTEQESPTTENNENNEPDPLVIRGIKLNIMIGKYGISDFVTFATYYIDKLMILKTKDGIFYRYRKGKYVRTTEERMKDLVYRDVIKHVPVDCYNIITHEKLYCQYISRECQIVKAMDADKNIVNLSNGLLYLDTMKFCEHNPTVLSSIQIPIRYDKEKDCPLFKKFLSEICFDDAECIAILQEVLGYSLTSDVSAQKAVILYGSGSNGKSVYLSVLSELVGKENISNLSIPDLDRPFARFDLVGKTINISSENEFKGGGFSTQYFKILSGGDDYSVEVKFGPTFTVTPTVKLIFALNNLPKTNDLTVGFRRRLLIVPFSKTITDDKADRHLTKKLKKEMSGILNFALEGLHRMRSQGTKFSESTRCEKALDMYFSDLEPMYLFVKECIVSSKGSKMTNKDIFAQYEGWLDHEGGTNKYDRISFSHEFKKALNVHKISFIIGKTTGGKRCLKGIAMKDGKQYFKGYTRTRGDVEPDDLLID